MYVYVIVMILCWFQKTIYLSSIQFLRELSNDDFFEISLSMPPIVIELLLTPRPGILMYGGW